MISSGFSQEIQDIDYSGDWAISDGDYSSTQGGFFLSIKKLRNQNKYFIISVNTKNSIFTFVGGGFVREDGYLQIRTDNGVDWLITPAFSTRHNRAISITNLYNIDSFGMFIPIESKFIEWPFPTGEESK